MKYLPGNCDFRICHRCENFEKSKKCKILRYFKLIWNRDIEYKCKYFKHGYERWEFTFLARPKCPTYLRLHKFNELE